MSTERVKATCIVELQIECGDVWSSDTTMGQIIKQAEVSANGRINKLFYDAADKDSELRTNRQGYNGISLVGIKKITTQAIVEK